MLKGLQIAITDYADNAADMPSSSELLWLPGIGETQASSTLECDTTVIPRTAGIERWDILWDRTGIILSAYRVSDGTTYSYGIMGQYQTTTQTYRFTPDYPMVGIFGYWNNVQVQAFGTINYDSAICPKAEPEPEVVEAGEEEPVE